MKGGQLFDYSSLVSASSMYQQHQPAAGNCHEMSAITAAVWMHGWLSRVRRCPLGFTFECRSGVMHFSARSRQPLAPMGREREEQQPIAAAILSDCAHIGPKYAMQRTPSMRKWVEAGGARRQDFGQRTRAGAGGWVPQKISDDNCRPVCTRPGSHNTRRPRRPSSPLFQSTLNHPPPTRHPTELALFSSTCKHTRIKHHQSTCIRLR